MDFNSLVADHLIKVHLGMQTKLKSNTETSHFTPQDQRSLKLLTDTPRTTSLRHIDGTSVLHTVDCAAQMVEPLQAPP